MTAIDCNAATLASADHLIELALIEDLQQQGDLTSQATVPPEATATVNVVAREAGVLCGAILIPRVYAALCARQSAVVQDSPANTVKAAVQVEGLLDDGSVLESGNVVACISGPVQLLLTGERIALNFLIHLSGIASLTAEFVKRAEGTQAAILDTRKTLPGYRLLQKYAVRCGGGTNHRMGLFDGMLIKDNHLAARGHSTVADAVTAARNYLQQHNLQLPVEVEVDTLEQLTDALAAKPEIVLLDNMRTAALQQAVSIRDKLAPATLLEASGGVNLETIGCISGSGVDRVSIGGLTHSAVALDLGYDWPW